MVEVKFYLPASNTEKTVAVREKMPGFFANEYDRSVRRPEGSESWIVVGPGNAKQRRFDLEVSVRTTSTLPTSELTALENDAREASAICFYADGMPYWELPVKGLAGMAVNRSGKVGWWAATLTFIVGGLKKMDGLTTDGGVILTTDTNIALVASGGGVI